jgi:hypothetical protein
LRYSATVISGESDIVSADPHETIGVDQSSDQLLSSPEFDHLPCASNIRFSAGPERSLD